MLLAFVPRLPSAEASSGIGLSNGSVRITTRHESAAAGLRGHADRRLVRAARRCRHAAHDAARAAGARNRGFNTQQRARGQRAGDVVRQPPEQVDGVLQRGACAGSRRCPAWSASRSARWCRGARRAAFGPGFQFSAEGYAKADGEEDPRARFRTVSPGFFAALGVPLIAGRDFTDADRRDGETVVIVSQSLAQRMFPDQRCRQPPHLTWTDPVMKFIDMSTGAAPHRRRRRGRGR